MELDPSVSGKVCLFSEGECQEAYDECKKYNDPTECETHAPLSGSNNIYNYNYLEKWYWDSSETSANKFKQRKRKCAEYFGSDSSLCPSLLPSDTNKVCVSNPNYGLTGSNNRCYEVYNSCEKYNNFELNKFNSREACENIELPDSSKRCVYIREIDKCMETQIYETCEAYKETDKFTCEAIKLNSLYSKGCILDKDSKCKEREFHCEDAKNEEDCHFYARASSDNLRCIFANSKCIETFKGCEDFTKIGEGDDCGGRALYNGKKCVLENENKCISRNKTCQEAYSEEECKLIIHSGVSDPERKVCSYFTSSPSSSDTSYYPRCKENYKFCSDYRGSDSGICRAIKPYDLTGSYEDITSECDINDKGICQRFSKGCSAANGNPIQCAELSKKIKNNHIKFCAYIGERCEEHYKNCENITSMSDCPNNKPEDYLTSYCEVKTIDGEQKCVKKKSCKAFEEKHYGDICSNINNNCTYDLTQNGESICLTNTTKNCLGMVFYSERDDYEAVCNSLETDSPNKICTYKKGTSKCEQIFKELPEYQTSENYKKEDNAIFIKNRIGFALALLFMIL